MFENVNWIFFDLGSTLVDERPVYDHIFRDMAAQTGLDYDFLYSEALKLFLQNQKGDTELCQRYGLPKRKWYMEDEVLYGATPSLLENLSKKYKLGVLANQQSGVKDRLKQWGILQYFDLIISSAEEGVSKPDPKIFQLALDRAGVEPQNALMVGDRIDNDILPAKKQGMHTLWVKQGFGGCWNLTQEEEQPDCTVEQISDIYNYL